ncbi:MAG: Folate-dependent protein for Fe/S cluster synthesis/repair in oxidative stress [Myxococcaceae bacterium]|nr:Folate-dependent protein for Fe/S cluster synthesis/repair in oxidative stress [Myxococcaceae bacterium]
MNDVGTQVEAARSKVLVVPETELVVLRVTGGDRQSWLNGLVTCDLAPLRPGDAAYGLAVTQKGRILADVTVLLGADHLLLAVPASTEAELRAALDKYLIMEDVEVEPEAANVVVLGLHGPASAKLVERARAVGAAAGAVDRTGLGGGVVIAGVEVRAAVESALREAATAEGGVWGDDAGWEALRIERGVPRFGKDFDLTTYPQEASLEKRAVSFEKGCYLGQEVVCMLELRGHVKRKLVALVLDDAGDVLTGLAGADVCDATGAKVGHVTSTAVSPTLGAPLVFAMVKAAQTDPQTKLAIGGRQAHVVDGPV